MTPTPATAVKPGAKSSTGAVRPETHTATLRIGLFGCPLDTGNAGVSALGMSTMLGLLRAAPAAQFTMFDYGRGERQLKIELGERHAEVQLIGCYNSRRYWRASNLTQMHWAARLGLSKIHPMTRELRELDAVLDISGGDSFADIYGLRRFNDVTLPKEVTAAVGTPLVLLPQTYGPYKSSEARERASRVVRCARQAWARDAHSHEILKELLGDSFDSTRHRSGVDVAFALPARTPRNAESVARLEALRRSSKSLVGLNVSGLLFNRPGDDAAKYGFQCSYKSLIEKLLHRLIEAPGVGIVLVPHVSPRRAMVDCDATACEALYQSLPAEARERVFVPTRPMDWDATELKWLIGRCSWFCGTRMHSCIGAISQGVPTTAIAYSDKTLGVFKTAQIGDCVVDPRQEHEEALLIHILHGFHERERIAAALEASLPALRTRLDEQFRAIVQGIAS